MKWLTKIFNREGEQEHDSKDKETTKRNHIRRIETSRRVRKSNNTY